MRELKDSGHDWLGKIPSSWSLRRGRFLFTQRNEKGNGLCLQLLSPSQKFGVIPQELLEKWTTHKAVKLKEDTDLSELKTVHVGDFCISLRSFQGGFEYSNYEGVVSPAYQIFYSKADIYNDYYRYLFKDDSFIDKMNSYTMSLRDGKNIAFFDFANTFLPVPGLGEQKRIASYLDSKCSKIDAIIEKQQTVIEKLKEYKLSLITEAVTKGLNPNGPMKDSGVDFIGNVPCNWEVCRLRNIGTTQNGISKSGEYFGHGFPFVSYGDVYRNFSLPKEVNGLVDSTEVERELYSVKKGDIFFTRTSETIEEVGLACVCEQNIDNATFAGFLIRVRPFVDKLAIGFAKYYFRSNHHRFYLVKEMNLVTRASLSQTLLKGMPVLLPPMEEQNQIADFLDRKCSAIDTTISKKQALIEKLTAYKKSLIYEVVTGKKEV